MLDSTMKPSKHDMKIAHALVKQNPPYRLAGMIIELANRLAEKEHLPAKTLLEFLIET